MSAPRLILRTDVLELLLAAIAGVPAGVKLSIPQLRDALVSQADVIGGIEALIAAGELDAATLRPLAADDAGADVAKRAGEAPAAEPAPPGARKARPYCRQPGACRVCQASSFERYGAGGRKARQKGAAVAESTPAAAPAEPKVQAVPAAVRKSRPYCRQPGACVAPSRGGCPLCQPESRRRSPRVDVERHSAAIRRGVGRDAAKRLNGEKVNGVASPAVRGAMNVIRDRNAAEERLSDPVQAAQLALQRKGRTVYSAEVVGGPKNRFIVSGLGREVTPAALIAEAERVCGVSFRRGAEGQSREGQAAGGAG